MSKLACSLFAVHLAACCLWADKPTETVDPDTVLATVGEDQITEADLQLFCAIYNYPLKDQTSAVNAEFVDRLVEQQLIRRFLAKHKITPNPEALESEVARIEDLISRRKQDPAALLKKLGLTKKKLEAELGLPLAWDAYVRLSITDKQIEDHFEQHRAELDGTKLRASQIILKLPKNPAAQEIDQRSAQLSALRDDILAEKLTFAEAAQKLSEAPVK